ncbi:hypothetical protein IHE45_14G073700 [Dioscorea alata]|uniref:Uncharacterized protein n=1 Tax=Dioscorea alata TaxID=55571 RepID=A0ACB7USQ4_DIOAL|nr:hypothetical protein IHE45_14G073700 [Dioscorea alata]
MSSRGQRKNKFNKSLMVSGSSRRRPRRIRLWFN